MIKYIWEKKRAETGTRATMRISWLLLSLSMLFGSVCPDNTTPVVSTVTAGTLTTGAGSPSGADPTVNSQTTSVTLVTAAASTQKEAPITSTTVDPLTTADTQVPIQTEPITVINPSSQISVSSVPAIVTNPSNPAATFSTPTIPGTAVTTATTVAAAVTVNSGGSSGAAATTSVGVQTPETPINSKTSRTEKPFTLRGNLHNVENITKASTESVAHSTIAPKMNEGDVEKTTVTVTRNGQTSPSAQEPPGNLGTTGTLPTLTKTGSDVRGNLTGATSPQTNTTAEPQSYVFQYTLNSKPEKEGDKKLAEVCNRLMEHWEDGNCTLVWRQSNGKVRFDLVEINGKVRTSLATQYYEELSMNATDNKTLIAILSSCGALLIMIVILTVCASHHRKPYSENQQHLTEELHTVENGYHDNPTLEVMEVPPEMQEKKVALNGEFNDSWIVPIDNLLKEDVPDEEDTHL
ncbi:podocalyxin isoform X2 [Toxotes jaculatrix]|uniref:podocalyxin isoform X2 n=1 Tax=Toxotes jaculatrix TaxID=941984 RepID=UPI001B3AD484|nr:podocalyxin isoform X2 [Toxotes jaculatrix]